MNQPHDAPNRGAAGPSSTPHVLIVDDDADIRAVLEMIFTEDGYTASTCDACDAALHVLQTHAISLLVTDLRLPGGGGTGLIHHIAAAPEPRPNIIVLTAMRSLDAIAELTLLRDLGGRVVTKPFDMETLLAIAHELTGWPGRA